MLCEQGSNFHQICSANLLPEEGTILEPCRDGGVMTESVTLLGEAWEWLQPYDVKHRHVEQANQSQGF